MVTSRVDVVTGRSGRLIPAFRFSKCTPLHAVSCLHQSTAVEPHVFLFRSLQVRPPLSVPQA